MEPIIKVDNVSMCFNLSKEKHESLKEYFLAMVQGRLQYDEFYPCSRPLPGCTSPARAR